MPKLLDLTGQKFGRLTAISREKRGNKAYWICKCSCEKGTVKAIEVSSLVSGKIRGCGCLRKHTPQCTPRHGEAFTTTHRIWAAILRRCRNPNCPEYKNYGGRGIQVCDRWLTYENFRDDMGYRPPGLSIDRKDNNGNYEKDNCHWTTPKKQGRNCRRNVNLSHDGRTQPISAWAEELNIRYTRLWYLVRRRGMSIPEAILNI